jgi:hypothetical protein
MATPTLPPWHVRKEVYGTVLTVDGVDKHAWYAWWNDKTAQWECYYSTDGTDGQNRLLGIALLSHEAALILHRDAQPDLYIARLLVQRMQQSTGAHWRDYAIVEVPYAKQPVAGEPYGNPVLLPIEVSQRGESLAYRVLVVTEQRLAAAFAAQAIVIVFSGEGQRRYEHTRRYYQHAGWNTESLPVETPPPATPST